MKNLALLLLIPALVSGQSLVLVGGGLADKNAAIWNKVVDLAGGKGVAKIGIFTTASADPEDSAKYYEDMFVKTYGAASATYIPVTETSNNADDPAVVSLVAQQTGFFFGGGDQLRVTKALKHVDGSDTAVLTALREALRAGAVIGGSSAGTACQGKSVMITGGLSWEALAYGAYPGGPDDSYPDDLSYDEKGGLGFLDGFVLDTHFSERGREGRLIRLLHDTKSLAGLGTAKGFGIDEDTALVITDLYTNPVGTVIGSVGGVFYADVSQVTSYPSQTTDYANARVSFLTLDDTIDLTTGQITFAGWKFRLSGNEYYNDALYSDDIFSSPNRPNSQSGEFRRIAARLFDNKNDLTTSNLSYESGPRFEVVMDKAGADGYANYLPDDQKTFVVSYKNMRVDIHEY